MANTHDCITNNCSGTRYDGANFTCNRCLKPSYVECNMNRKEVGQLIQIINKDTTLNDNRLNNKLKLIINQESVFEFTCQQCKATGSYTEKIEKEKKQHERMITIYKNRIRELEEETKTQQQRISEIETINAQIINRQINEKDENMQTDEEQNTLEANDKITDICKIMEEKLINLKTEIETKIKNETDKIMNVMSANNIIVIENERKRKKITTKNNIQIPSTSDNTQTTHPNSFDVNLTGANNNNNIKKLKPPKEENQREKGLYEIFISKFATETTEKQIEEHIIDNTNINKDTFKIEKLISKKEENKKKYVSFKISTFKKEIYNEIIDEKLWAPEFNARDYVESFKKKIQINYTQERRTHDNRHNNFIIYTPKPKPINTRVDRRQILPTNTQMNRMWNTRTEYNETPRSTQHHRYQNIGKGRFTMNRESNRHQDNNYRTNYENRINFNTPYQIRNENFRHQNPTPKIKQKREEQQRQEQQEQEIHQQRQ